jgi:hypothetical protein
MIQRSTDDPWTTIDGEVLMMSIERGQYFALNGVASRIWELLEKPVEPEAIAAGLTAEYDVPAATCAAQLERFLQQLRDRGMLIDMA